MKFMKFLNLVIVIIVASTLFGCSDDDDTTSNSGMSRISVRLMDNPGDYEHVFVDVQDVMIKMQDSEEGEDGWASLEAINTGVYDLLELTAGINVLLVDDYEIPSGELQEIRLVLGDDNTIVIDGERLPLQTPSAQQSGLKIKVNEYLESNIHYTFLLDFDVDQSVVVAGNSGNINLKPVIKASVQANTGAISGKVIPSGVQTVVTASNGTNMVSTYVNGDGEFLLLGLEPAEYSLNIIPDPDSGFAEKNIDVVKVELEETTDLGEIILE